MALIARVGLALGVDGLARWVVGALVTLICVSLLVALIVIQTVATLLTGGQADATSPAEATPGATTIQIPTPAAVPAVDGDLGSHVIQLAQMWLGVPYVFGGCSRAGVDCSCLVQNVYAAVGIHLPRVAVDQFNATSPISEPQLGDLVFFANTYEPGISHVGIYIGNGLQINAPTTGQVVSVAPVFTGYWGAHYAGARRVHV
jgi:cell wall-associated NlpC family hydrolase